MIRNKYSALWWHYVAKRFRPRPVLFDSYVWKEFIVTLDVANHYVGNCYYTNTTNKVNFFGRNLIVHKILDTCQEPIRIFLTATLKKCHPVSLLWTSSLSNVIALYGNQIWKSFFEPHQNWKFNKVYTSAIRRL